MPSWFIGSILFWMCVALGTGIRLYRTRYSWMRKYRDDQSQR